MGTSTLFPQTEKHSVLDGVGAEVPTVPGIYPEEGSEVYPQTRTQYIGSQDTEMYGHMDEGLIDYEDTEEDDVHDPTTRWHMGYDDHEYGEPLPDAKKEWLGDRSPVFELNGSL